MGILANFFRFVPAAAGYGQSVLRQKKFIRVELQPLLAEAWANNDGTLDDKLRKRITNYALYTTTICGAIYALLHNRPLSSTERLLQSTLGALTPLYDDFFDHPNLSPDQVKTMMDDPFGFSATTSRERLFINLLQRIHRLAPNVKWFTEVFHRVYLSQQESKQQTEAALDEQQLEKIVLNKGGQAALLFRTLVAAEPIEGETEAIWHWGALLQLLDDTFDIYEDHQEGIRTVANTSTDMEAYEGYFHNHVSGLVAAIRALNTPARQREAAIGRMLFVLCWAFVALDQLAGLQRQHGKPFTVANFERKALICDMDKVGNQLRGMRLYCAFPI